MAEHYSGKNVTLELGATDISGYARSVDVAETAGAPDTLDSTHKGDSERQTIEGFPGAQETNINMTVLDIYDALTEYGTVALNTKTTVIVYPYGKTHTYPMLTCQNARLHDRSQTAPYDGMAELTLSWNAKNSLTRSTYSSA